MSLVTNIIETTKNMFKIPELKRRILVTIALLVVYRIGWHIPVPGINPAAVRTALGGGGPLSDILGTFAMLSGGSLLQCTLFALGIMPYISAEIIFQLLTKVIPSLEELSKEGEAGRRKIRQYSRYTTVVICVVQAFFVVTLLVQWGIVPRDEAGFGFTLTAILALTAGTFFLMWLGEMITEHGIGNGVSLIIMAGILASLPSAIAQLVTNAQADPSQMIPIILLALGFFAIVAVVVLITLGQRRIPIQHARHVAGRRVYGGQRSDLALKVDQPGVIPIIFASALLTFPAMLVAALKNTSIDNGGFFDDLVLMINDELARGGFIYILLYIILTFFFCFFWTKLMFNPVELAKNMKEYGSFIPGIRPGRKTVEYIDYVVNRITLAGATFLSIIAVVPLIVSALFNIPMLISGFLGGTGLLIVVGVALDLVHKVEGHLKMRHYDGFLGHGGQRMRGRR